MDIQNLSGLLKTKYPQSGLGDNEINGIAASLIATGLVTDENAQQIVDAQADTIRGFQSLFDARYTSKKDNLTKSLTETLEKTFREKYHINAEGKQEQPKTDPKPDDNANLFKQMLGDALKPIMDRFAQEDNARKAAERMAEIVEAAKRNGIPEQLARELNVPQDADLDTYMKDKSQTFANLGFQKVTPPSAGKESETDAKAVAALIRAGAPKKDGNK